MQSHIALILCFLFTLYLFKIDINRKPDVSGALWIPLIWLLIISSRMISQWIGYGGAAMSSVEDYAEGNPIDRPIFTALMIIGLVILLRRKISLSDTIKKNAWIFIYFAFWGISIAWSDLPDVTFKRYIKAIGSLIMVLVILTEPAPVEAFKTIMRRCAYVHIPLSIVLYKYYPHLGRTYGRWSGQLMITGVTLQKNALGILCAVCGIVFISDIIARWRNKKALPDGKGAFPRLIILIMIFWLLIMANSATAIACFIIGCGILLAMELPMIKRNPKSLVVYLFFLVCIILILQIASDLTGMIFSSLGRDTTLTGRTDLWKDALALVKNPLIGYGFESFWLGDRMQFFWDKYYFRPNEAHNGYLEVYLDGGVIAVLLLIVIILNAFKNIYQEFSSDLRYATVQSILLAMALANNITEASFRPLQLMGFLFFLAVIKPPQTARVSKRETEPQLYNDNL